MNKNLLSALAMALTFIGFLPYVVSVVRGRTKPHVFSWIIWGLTTVIVFFAQLEDRGGVGAWPIGVSGAITAYIGILAYRKKSDTAVTPSDWVFLAAALSSLPLWFFTSDPLWAVVVLTIVDLLGFGPTLRKAYAFPFEEQATFYALFALRNLVASFALENYSVTTLFFPVATGIACVPVPILILYRRRVMSSAARQ